MGRGVSTRRNQVEDCIYCGKLTGYRLHGVLVHPEVGFICASCVAEAEKKLDEAPPWYAEDEE